MTKVSKRQRRLAAQKLYKKPVSRFEEITRDQWPSAPKGMTQAFRNSRFTVMIYGNMQTSAGGAVCALVQNHANTPIHNHWAEMQKIKNEIFGPEVMAIEYFPPESQLLNTHNIYWMWIFKEGVIPHALKSNQ